MYDIGVLFLASEPEPSGLQNPHGSTLVHLAEGLVV